MRMVNVAQTEKLLTVVKYHAASDSLVCGGLDTAELLAIPLGEGTKDFPKVALLPEHEGVFDFDIDPKGKSIALAAVNFEAALLKLGGKKWELLSEDLFQIEEQPYSGGFCQVYFLPYANQVCFAAMGETMATFRLDMKQETQIDWIIGINRSVSVVDKGKMLCFHSNWDGNAYHHFHFAADEETSGEPTHRKSVVTHWCRGAHLHPDGRRLILVASSFTELHAEVWDLECYDQLAELKEESIRPNPTPDSYTERWNQLVAQNFEYASDDAEPHTSFLCPNGRWLFCPIRGLAEGTAALAQIEVDSLQVTGILPMPHQSMVTGYCFLPKKHQVATASLDGSVALWEFDDVEWKKPPKCQIPPTLREHLQRYGNMEGISFVSLRQAAAAAEPVPPKSMEPVEMEEEPDYAPPEVETRSYLDVLREASTVSPVLAIARVYWRGSDIYNGLLQLEAILKEPDLQQTAASKEVEEKRGFAAIDWSIHKLLPVWLKLFPDKYQGEIEELRQIPTIDSWPSLLGVIRRLNQIYGRLNTQAIVNQLRQEDGFTGENVREILHLYSVGGTYPQAVSEGLMFLTTQAMPPPIALPKGSKWPNYTPAIYNVAESYPHPDQQDDAREWADLLRVARKAAAKFARDIDSAYVEACVVQTVKICTLSKFSSALRLNMNAALHHAESRPLFTLMKTKADQLMASGEDPLDSLDTGGKYYENRRDALLKELLPLENELIAFLAAIVE